MKYFYLCTVISWISILYCTHPRAEQTGPEFKPCPKILPERMGCIPGGEFLVGSNTKDWAKENPELSSLPERKITLDTFLIDQYEVTTGQYQKCVQEKKCTPARSNYPYMRGDTQPQVKANWYQADAYCRAQGKRLPTEAEFEAASRGPNGETYPWGNALANCKVAIIKDESGRGCLSDPARPNIPRRFLDSGTTWPVGSRPAERHGLYDMGGNAQEWVSDWFAPTLEKCGKDCTGKNPAGPCAGQSACGRLKEKLTKGGGWYWGPISARSAARRPYWPKNDPPHHFGFRCVKSVN